LSDNTTTSTTISTTISTNNDEHDNKDDNEYENEDENEDDNEDDDGTHGKNGDIEETRKQENYRKRPRHASFSASSSNTYKPISNSTNTSVFQNNTHSGNGLDIGGQSSNDKNGLNAYSNSDGLFKNGSVGSGEYGSVTTPPLQTDSSNEDRPHQQVGFSTPQLGPQDLALIDYLLPDMQLHQDEKITKHDANNHHHRQHHGDLHDTRGGDRNININGNNGLASSLQTNERISTTSTSNKLHRVFNNLDSILPPQHFVFENQETDNQQKDSSTNNNIIIPDGKSNTYETASKELKEANGKNNDNDDVQQQAQQLASLQKYMQQGSSENSKKNKNLMNLNLAQLPLYSTMLNSQQEQLNKANVLQNSNVNGNGTNTPNGIAAFASSNKTPGFSLDMQTSQVFNSPSIANLLMMTNPPYNMDYFNIKEQKMQSNNHPQQQHRQQQQPQQQQQGYGQLGFQQQQQQSTAAAAADAGNNNSSSTTIATNSSSSRSTAAAAATSSNSNRHSSSSNNVAAAYQITGKNRI